MEDLRNAHDVVVERMPAKDAPAFVWAEFYRWSADTYASRGNRYWAAIERHRAELYERNP